MNERMEKNGERGRKGMKYFTLIFLFNPLTEKQIVARERSSTNVNLYSSSSSWGSVKSQESEINRKIKKEKKKWWRCDEKMEGLLSENLSSNDLKSENKRERERRETTNVRIGEKGKM